MPDAGYLDQVLGWLRGGSPAGASTNPDLTKPAPYTSNNLNMGTAPPLSAYPSNEDADYARKYGFGYGSGNEPYLNNERARVIGANLPVQQAVPKGQKPPPPFNLFLPNSAAGLSVDEASQLANNPKKSSVIDLNGRTVKSISDDLHNVIMRAGLAANRIPVATAGFDPERVALDTIMASPWLSGVYSPKGDSMYSVTGPDAIVHESMHRGIAKLRQAYPEEMAPIDNHLSNEEMIVRYLMKSQAGDQENIPGPGHEVGAKQRQDSIDIFEHPHAQSARDHLNALQELAIRYKKEKNPRGPH